MELRHLRYFVAVAELGSISHAAEKLFIAQPPLSFQIKQLEEEIGVPLFIRYPRGVRLTPAGRIFLEEARDVLARADRAKRLARQTGNDAGGLVRIGYVPTVGHTILPRLLRQLRAIRPQIEIEAREMISGRQVQALTQNEIDAAFLRPPIDIARVEIAVEVEDPFCLAIPELHPLFGKGPIDLRAAAKAVFVNVTRQRGPAFFDQTVGLCTDVGFNPDIRYEASTLYGVIELVRAGLGVAVVPASTAMLGSEDIQIRLLQRPTRSGSIAFAQLRDDPNPLLAEVVQLTKGVFAQLRRELKGRIAGGR